MNRFCEAWKYNPWWWNLGFGIIAILAFVPFAVLVVGLVLVFLRLIAIS